MPLETPTYLMDLVETNPPGTDPKNQGDNHIRNIKLALKNTFPTANRAFNLRRWAEKEAAFETQAADRTMVATDDGKMQYFDCTAASRTFNLLAVASAPEGMVVFVSRSDTDVNNLTLDPAGVETINGAGTLVLTRGQQGILYRTSTEWEFLFTNRSPSTYKVEVFTASGSYTRKAGCKSVKVTVLGGGGSGGGAGTTAAGQASAGSGGSAGGTAYKTIPATSLGTTETVTVGAAVNGTAGAAGTAGNSSSFGAHCSATGGAGGAFGGATASNISVSSPGAGGVGSSGDVNVRGGLGNPARREITQSFGGKGGDSTLGGGGAAAEVSTTSAGSAAQANSGGGGGGGANGPSQGATVAGGQGAAGIVIVEEFY